MKSKMTECYDYRKLKVPEELGKWRFPESDIQKELEALARDYSGEQEVTGEIEDGCSVQCVCTGDEEGTWEGRTVLLYPGRKLPGAEAAEEAVRGRKTGDVFSCEIAGKTVTLEVKKAVRKKVMEAGDELAAMLGLPGVGTVEDYARWYHEKHDPVYREKACIRISQFWLEEMMERSSFAIDEEEKRGWCMGHAKTMYRSLAAAGMNPCRQQDGTILTEEETLEKLAAEQERYFVPNVMYEYFCEKDNYHVTEEDMEEMVKQMAAEKGENPEELMKQADFGLYRQTKYQEHTFHMLMAEAEPYLEV